MAIKLPRRPRKSQTSTLNMVPFLRKLCCAHFLLSHWATAAGCCGGGSSLASLITNDDKIQFRAYFDQSEVVATNDASGLSHFPSDGSTDTSRTLKLGANSLLSDRLQYGINIPLTQRRLSDGITSRSSNYNVGDIQSTLAFEAVPERLYNVWKPRVYLFLQNTWPTGKSLFTSKDPIFLDVTGRGLYTLSLGTLLTKSWGPWDCSLQVSGTNYFSRKDASTLLSKNFLGTEGSFDIGYSPPFNSQSWRIGANVGHKIEFSSPTLQRRSLLGLQLTKMWGQLWTTHLSFSDQSLLGPAKNTTLSRSLGISISRRWER